MSYDPGYSRDEPIVELIMDLAEKALEDMAKSLGERLGAHVAEKMDRDVVKSVIGEVIAGRYSSTFWTYLVLAVSKKIANEILDSIELVIGDKIVVSLGEARAEIDARQLLDELAKRIHKLLSTGVERVVQQAIREALHEQGLTG